MSRIAVLGSGAWGTALALALHRRGGHRIILWSHSEDEASQISGAIWLLMNAPDYTVN